MILQNIKRRWVLILGLLAVMCTACLLVACASDPFDPLENGYTATVVYDANGGKYSTADTTGVRTFRYKPGTTIIQPAEGASLNIPTRDSYHVVAWYPAVLDEEGKPLKEGDLFVDEDGVSIFEGEEWDFSQKLPEDEQSLLYLVAGWKENYTFTIDVGEEARSEGVENYFDDSYTSPSNVGVIVDPPARPGYTVRYYMSEDGRKFYGTQALRELQLSDETPDVVVTVEWLKGDWIVVSKAEDLANIDVSANYFIDSDIDMGGEEFTFSGYSGEFNGNGHTISNFKTDGTSSGKVAFSQFSFSGGFMHDITFKDAVYSFRLRGVNNVQSVTAGFIAADASGYDLGKFTNIAFDNCSLIVVKGTAANVEVIVGIDTTYHGIFGRLGDGQSFAPSSGSVSVEIG